MVRYLSIQAILRRASPKLSIPLTNTWRSADSGHALDFLDGWASAFKIAPVSARKPPSTPCLLISNDSRKNQEFLWTDLWVARYRPASPPSLLIIGEVARGDDIELSPPAIAMLQDSKIPLICIYEIRNSLRRAGLLISS